MKKKKIDKIGKIICVILIIITFEAAFILYQSFNMGQTDAVLMPKVRPVLTVQGTPTAIPTTAETPYPKPTYNSTLRPYDIDKSHDIWHAKDPSSYVTPENEWVKYYASQLFVDYDGRIKYKNENVVWWIDKKGTYYYTYKPFLNNYSYDIYKQAYGYYDRNNIPWIMPDYYLTHGMTGVCSAWAVTITSLMLSGEMSTKNGDNFTKQVIPAKVVLGYTKSGLRDGWVEYTVYNNTWITTTSLMKYGLFNEEEKSSTEFNLKKDMIITPVFEFTDKNGTLN